VAIPVQIYESATSSDTGLYVVLMKSWWTRWFIGWIYV